MGVKIKCENLTYTYSIGTPFQKTAVDNLNLEIMEGEFIGLIGHTGSGKSTLVTHLNGLLKPTSGRVLLDGADIWGKDINRQEIRFRVGLVFQYPEYQLFEETVYKDIAFGPTNMGLSREKIDENVRFAAELTGIGEELFEKSPFELSGGQKRRVAIAGVLAMEPEVLILDEPTAGLDPHGRDEILSRINDYHRRRKSTIVLVSHSMEDIAKQADRVLVMNRASVAMFDTVEKVFSRSAELELMGLSVPQISKLVAELIARGLPIDAEIYTVDRAREALLKLLR